MNFYYISGFVRVCYSCIAIFEVSLGEYKVDDDKYRSIKFGILRRDRMEVQGDSITLLCLASSTFTAGMEVQGFNYIGVPSIINIYCWDGGSGGFNYIGVSSIINIYCWDGGSGGFNYIGVSSIINIYCWDGGSGGFNYIGVSSIINIYCWDGGSGGFNYIGVSSIINIYCWDGGSGVQLHWCV